MEVIIENKGEELRISLYRGRIEELELMKMGYHSSDWYRTAEELNEAVRVFTPLITLVLGVFIVRKRFVKKEELDTFGLLLIAWILLF